MRVWSVYGLREGFEVGGVGVWLQALGTQMRPRTSYCAAAAGSDTPAATAVTLAEVRR